MYGSLKDRLLWMLASFLNFFLPGFMTSRIVCIRCNVELDPRNIANHEAYYHAND